MIRLIPLISFLVTLISSSINVIAHSGGHEHHAANAPLVFVPNLGQWGDYPFLYKGLSANADVYLEPDGVRYLVGHSQNQVKIHEHKISPEIGEQTLYFHTYKAKWIGANYAAQTEPSKKQDYYHNYYLGDEPSRHVSNVGVYKGVTYKSLYPKIDLHFGTEKGHLKYEYVVQPGGNPQDIQMEYTDVDKIEIIKGELVITTSVGKIVERAPYVFQYINDKLTEVTCKYKLKGNVLTFDFPKGYNKNYALIIDPTVVFATLTGSAADNWGFTATYDKDGNFYAGGIANGIGYPTTTGAFQIIFGGGSTSSSMPCDITISKFNASGTALVYSTYLGGNQDDMPHSMVVDHQNNLIVVGKTLSTNFPVTANAYKTTHANSNDIDIIISKFNANGTGLLASTYLGGSADDGSNTARGFGYDTATLRYNYGDNFRSEVIVDNVGNIYIAASTQSNDFPVTPNAVKSFKVDNQDGVFVKFNPQLSTLIYSTLIGGSGSDAAYVLALDTAQTYVYIAGGTKSTDFHSNVTTGAYRSTYQGGQADGFICKIQNGNSYPMVRATYIGTNAYDQCYGIQVDLEDNVYVMGQTLGAFPVSAGVYSNPNSRQFVQKLNNTLNTSIYSTVFGTGAASKPNLSLVAFLVDTCQNVYISGWGASSISSGTNTTGLPVTGNAFQSTTDGQDFYFIVFSKNAQNLLLGSFFGASGKSEHVDGGTSRFNPHGVVYQAMCASCFGGTGFPSTPGAFSAVNGSNNCNLGAVKIAFNLGSVNAEASANPDASGCVPLTVNFGNGSNNATSYTWDFGDGSPQSNAVTPTHTYTSSGTFTARLIAYNPNACKERDTVYLTIRVSDDTIRANFTHQILDSCERFIVAFNNTSHELSSGGTPNYYWDFGDGSTFVGKNPPAHTYTSQGTYNVRLIMTDTGACNSPDTIIKPVTIQSVFVKTKLNPPPPTCQNDTVVFVHATENATGYQWDFGDGHYGTDPNGKHVYDSVGTFTVKLKVTNPNSCNKEDSASVTVTVAESPTANFIFKPIQPERNKPTEFLNRSVGASSYHWDFGDGRSSTEENPVHQFFYTGTFNVCLTAYNEIGCDDKICRKVSADVVPLVDVPTGFSPNGDGNNDILYVRGFNIETIDFKIYNRWGELVFESFDQSYGWDGTYKGELQEMEAYAFTLWVKFYDGTTAKRQGNVTLLR